MRFIKPVVGTVCVGNAFGEAAMLLAAGEPVSGSGHMQARLWVGRWNEKGCLPLALVVVCGWS